MGNAHCKTTCHIKKKVQCFLSQTGKCLQAMIILVLTLNFNKNQKQISNAYSKTACQRKQRKIFKKTEPVGFSQFNNIYIINIIQLTLCYQVKNYFWYVSSKKKKKKNETVELLVHYLTFAKYRYSTNTIHLIFIFKICY